jgi:SAM-dependent methyltransferase
MTILDVQTAAYSPAFAHYEENRIVHEAYGRCLADRISSSNLRSVLSLGIGHREVARQIIGALGRASFRRYVIVDASTALIEAMQAEMSPFPPGLDLLEGWFESFEVDGRFDLIEAGFVLEHVEDPAIVLNRMHRFLAPGGRMVVAVPNACSLHRLIGSHAGLLTDVYALGDADRALGHRRYFDLPRLQALLDSCGWRVERTTGMLLKPFTTAQMARLGLTPAIWGALQSVASGLPAISNAIQVEVVPV